MKGLINIKIMEIITDRLMNFIIILLNTLYKYIRTGLF